MCDMTQVVECIGWLVWMLLTWTSQRGHAYHKIYHEKAKSLVGHGRPTTPPLY